MNNFIETNGENEFKNIFESYILSHYECVYIGFGSKYNQNIITYNTQINKTIQKYSNANWQLLPGFVRNRKTLAVCIDRFENDDTKQENKKILNQQLESNITMIICDVNGTIPIFENILIYIVEQLNLYSIHKNNVIIVNYLRFIYPNNSENYLEQYLPVCLQKVLLHTIYKNSFYQWFGYQPNLYNIIYRYNNRSIYHLLSSVCNILQNTIRNNELTILNMNKLLGKSLDTQLLILFFKNIYDITLVDDMKSFYDYNQFIC